MPLLALVLGAYLTFYAVNDVNQINDRILAIRDSQYYKPIFLLLGILFAHSQVGSTSAKNALVALAALIALGTAVKRSNNNG